MKYNRPYFYGKTFPGLLVMFMAAGLFAAEETLQKNGADDAYKRSTVVKRDPFWPVGYVPENTQVTGVSPNRINTEKEIDVGGWSGAMKQVAINGVSSRSDDEYYAVINGEIKRVGDTVSVRQGGTLYTWVVDGIEPPESVKLRRLSSE